MINVLLCGEGVTEYGRIGKDGVLQVLMLKCVGGKELSFVVRTRGDIKRYNILPIRNNSGDLTARKIAAMAKQADCRHIAYHRDEDNQGFREMYAQVEAYFSVAREKGMKCVAVVPVHMTESWLLADEKAFRSTPTKPALPKKPEETWGNPDSRNHPKKYLERVLEQFEMERNAESMAEIAEKIDVEILKKKCKSFECFCGDMERFIRD